jgi:hypothetical protein
MAACRHDAVRACLFDWASNAAHRPASLGDDELCRGAVSTAAGPCRDRAAEAARPGCSVGGRRMGLAGKALDLAARRLGSAAARRLFRALDRVPARQRATPFCAGCLARVERRAASKSCRTGGRSERIGGRGAKYRGCRPGSFIWQSGVCGCSSLCGCSGILRRSGVVGWPSVFGCSGVVGCSVGP